jgi:lipid-binding SYLF domain-containing protein
MASVVGAGFAASAADEPVEQQKLVDKSRITFERFMADERMNWFRERLGEARGLLIFPDYVKLGFVIGGSGGNGVLVVKDMKTREWSQPAFYSMTSVTFGLQIGGEKSEVILIVRTQKGLDSLYKSSFKVGYDTSIAAGPVGKGTKTDALADFVSFTRSKGAFIGLSLEGASIKAMDDWNQAYYGEEVKPVDIIVNPSISNSGSAELRATVGETSK